MSKKLIVVLSSIFVILILIVGSITFLPQNKSETINQDKAVQQDSVNTQNVSLIIDFGNNESVNYSTIPNKDQTAYTLLVEAASTNNLMLSTKQYDFGVFVEAIGDYKNSDEKAWIYYINGESATVAADNSELINGDFVEWKYEEPNY